jgi:hypothetical protein
MLIIKIFSLFVNFETINNNVRNSKVHMYILVIVVIKGDSIYFIYLY